jgi:hypothetical protein
MVRYLGHGIPLHPTSDGRPVFRKEAIGPYDKGVVYEA